LQNQTAGLRQFTTLVPALSSRIWLCSFKLSHYQNFRNIPAL
jgi:hypothetical protein